ncbi:superoxide dismutase [Cu-Zn], chloroplastic-like [Cajanus cajan]|uniref:superoxide dismutase [Cu-Zn], chloroplastic-like n=1 Tax=Cajanus cajan TaxID=3821 RepID=UPI00098D95A9|nr:superoxide dismutase [Cu-Zn], chloroplastic-like [Cajanus cajan]
MTYLGAHFNPNNLTNGAPKDEIRHAGDLGNIIANADGAAKTTIVDNQIPLSGPNSVVGRALVVHELGKGAHFNPNNLTNGAPKDEIRHAGDLGNIIANADGAAKTTVERPVLG